MNDPPSSTLQHAARLGEAIRRLHRALSPYLISQLAGEMQDLDLSFSQMGALFHLRAAGSLTVSSIARSAHLSLPAASHLVERLVRRGLLLRAEDPGNRRQKQVALSDAGRSLLDRFEHLTAEAYAALLAEVPEDVLGRAEEALEALLTSLPETAPRPPCFSKEPA